MNESHMTVKAYLGQAYHLDKDIQTKLLQVQAFRDLATHTTSRAMETPRSSSPDRQQSASLVEKIVDLENEMNADIDRLVELKAEIAGVIEQVSNREYRVVLELRYLYFRDWKQIALAMHYSVRWVHTIHLRALDAVEMLLQAHEAV